MSLETSTLLKVDKLKTVFHTRTGGTLEAVNQISFSIAKGETLGIVGESGSGKSVTALSILRLLENHGEISSGKVLFNNLNLKELSEKEMRKIRGKEIAMIFQDPMTCLDPVYTIGDQIIEAIKIHEDLPKTEYVNRAIELLDLVGIPDAKERINSYPHQLSGGQRQRVMIAIALACKPKLIIADEPTTALDVTVQAQILELLKGLQAEFGTAIILVTHDLGVVAEMADRVVVCYAGEIVEESDVVSLFSNPAHPYSEALLKSIPRLETNSNERLIAIKGSVPNLSNMPSGCRFHPRCPYAMEKCKTDSPPYFSLDNNRFSKCWLIDKNSTHSSILSFDKEKIITKEKYFPARNEENLLLEVKNLSKYFPIKKGLFSKTVGYVRAVDGISFEIFAGETLGLVGESGCGKSTTGRLVTGLIRANEGEVIFSGNNLSKIDRKTLKSLRKKMQFIFQDPYSSLNPRMPIKDIIAEPLEVHDIAKGDAKLKRVAELLEIVGLSRSDLHKYPHQFSGGQRQRIGIARALATDPELVICDEAVSALDVSVQAQILNLLKDLQEERGYSYLFISHDLNVVKYISHRVAVMYLGEIVEVAESENLFKEPLHPYSKALISAVPVPNPLHSRERIILKGEVPSPSNPPTGCKFHTRCPDAKEQCKQIKPVQKEVLPGHYVACHLY